MRRSGRVAPRGEQAPKRPRSARTRGSHSTATAASPHGPSIAIDALPTDVLVLVFAFISFPARLRTVSLVCRPWRTAVLRTETRYVAFSDGPLAKHHRALPLFSAVTELYFSPHPFRHVPLPLPRTLRRLTLLNGDGDWPAAPFTYTQPPPLAHLDLSNLVNGGDFLIPLLNASISSLERLTLTVPFGSLGDEVRRLLATTHFPALRELMFLQPKEDDPIGYAV